MLAGVTLVQDRQPAPRVRVVLAPTDLRRRGAVPPPDAPPWTAELYAQLADALAPFKR